MNNNQAGFSLTELLIVIIIIGILAGAAILNYQRVIGLVTDTVQKTRLMNYVAAQNKYRTALGQRRFGKLTELCGENLLSPTDVKFDAGCNQISINGWIIVPGDETIPYLRDHFYAQLKKEFQSPSDPTPTYCVSDDGVLRRSAPGSVLVCDAGSAPDNQ